MARERERALKLAIKALEAQRHVVAIDANLYDHYGARSPQALHASQKRKEINQAIEELKKILAELKAAREKPLLDLVKQKTARAQQQRNQPSLFGEPL